MRPLKDIAQVGGLNAGTADPTGVFVSQRTEPGVAQVLGRDDLQGRQRNDLCLDLTKPNGMFMARDFVIRERRTRSTSHEAPFTQMEQKVISSITGSAQSVQTASRRSRRATDLQRWL